MKEFTLELDCDNALWHRFNIYLSVVCFDADGTQSDFCNLAKHAEQSAQKNQALKLITRKCSKITIHLYIIPEIFPQSKAVDSLPTLQANLKVSSQGKTLDLETIDVDQLGGGSISGKEITL
ncbi:MAG: hypothetical protein R3Y38_04345 [Rikenellaceae bacterium]